MNSKRFNVFGIGSLLLLVACSTPPKDPEIVQVKEEKKDDHKQKKENLKRQIDLSRMKLEIGKLAAQIDETVDQNAIAKAKNEKDLAERDLKQFNEVEFSKRLEESKINLQEAKDALQDAKEDLAQLEETHKGGDLADKNRELVLQRSKRRVERAEKRLSLLVIDQQAVERYRLPSEREKLTQFVKDRSDSLYRAEQEAGKSKLERKLAVAEIEAELAMFESELAELEALQVIAK